MRTVVWTDNSGYKHKSVVRDQDGDDVAQRGMGLSNDPPNVNDIDWEAVKRNLHNLMLDRNLTTWSAVKRSDSHIGGLFIQVLKGPVMAWLREVDKTT